MITPKHLLRALRNNPKIRWALPAAVLALFLLPGSQLCAEVQSAQTTPQFSSTELQNCRAELQTIMANYYEIARLLNSDKSQRIAAEAMDKIAQLPEEQISVFAAAGSKVSDWLAATQTLRDRLTATAAAESARVKEAIGPASPGFPSATYSTVCGSTRSDTDTLFGFKVAYQAARVVWDAAGRGCNQVVVAVFLGEGGGGNTSLACIVADVIFRVAESVLEDFQFCDDSIDSAEVNGTYTRVDHIHNDLGTVDGKIDAINAKLDALAAAVEALRQANCEITRLLNTPEGRRSSNLPVCSDQPGFPYNFPQKQ